MLKVLITGCGSEGALCIIKMLREAYKADIAIMGLDTDNYNPNQTFLDGFFISPKREEKNFLDFVIGVMKIQNVDILWPIPTLELELFAEKKAFIESQTNAKIIIGDLDGIAIANNKRLLYQEMKTCLPQIVPEFLIANSKEEMEENIFSLGYPEKVVCIKKDKGAGAQGFRILDAQSNRSELLFYTNPNNTKCHWEDIKNIISTCAQIPPYMVCEYLPGEEWDCDILCFQGKCHFIITRENLRMVHGMAKVTRVKHNAVLEEYSKRIVEELSLSYIVQICFKKAVDGTFKLIEINPRVPGTIIATLYAGINFAELAIALTLKQKIQKMPEKEYKEILISKYWNESIIE